MRRGARSLKLETGKGGPRMWFSGRGDGGRLAGCGETEGGV